VTTLRFFTAVFGREHLRAGVALTRTFSRYNTTPLTVFTDQPGWFEHEKEANFAELATEYPSFYNQEGGRRNVFKYALTRRMQESFPGESVCWIDADMLVFDDLTQHLSDGHINVIAHGRRSESMNCGGGLRVPGEMYAISGLFALPPGPALGILETVTRERPHWEDDGSPNHNIGDQLILNHLLARTEVPVHWLTDDRRYIYNLEVADGLHPAPGDPALKRVRWHRRPVLDGRRIVVFYWIKSKLDRHLQDEFCSFRPSVARRLMRLYSL